ncbi:MAG: flagellar export chaperone FliS [Fimbriimonadaceae bacterium]|nr:flagellar export chaperone FliS [Fimbriimonadaceae bacterium]
MSQSRYLHEYQKNAVNGASPLQLILMLYDGALRFMEAGKRAMEAGDLEAQNKNLQRAQRIVLELTSCLDMEQGGEIATHLFSLYSYVLNQLVEANVNDDPGGIDRSMQVLSDLRSSWDSLSKSLSPEPEEMQRAA